MTFATLGFVSIILTTFLLKVAADTRNEKLFLLLVYYWTFVCIVFGAQIAYTDVKLYRTFKRVFDGEIEREDKQILCYVLMFSVCYLFMSLSNIFKIFNDPFETLQFNLGAYFI